MRLLKASSIICLVLLSVFLPVVHGGEGDIVLVAVVAVVPGKIAVDVGDVFAVDIWIYNVTDMAAWQIELEWNISMLYCTKARVNIPVIWGGTPWDSFGAEYSDMERLGRNFRPTVWLLGPGITNIETKFSAGTYLKCAIAIPDLETREQHTVNGSLSIVTLWLQALQKGSTSMFLDLTILLTPIEIAGKGQCGEPQPSFLAIPHVDCGCVVEIREPINIPTQHAAWLKK